ncbi:MAG: hypothetical protein K8S16_16095 [Bacteroidales bacterium]|nr:hypothetical protein [Bacteroidales bacterium]
MKQTLFFILNIILISSFSQNWSEPVNISTMNGVNQTPGFAIDNEGNLHCVWAHVINDNYSHIYYSKSEDNGATWITPENISLNTEKRLINPNIVTDSEGRIYVTYDWDAIDPAHGKILMKIYDGISWSLADTITGSMLNCRQNKLIVDHNNRIYCFWNHAVQYYGDYYYRYFENGIWSDFFYPYGTGVGFDKIVIDPDNNLHVLGGHVIDSYFLFAYFDYNLEANQWSDVTTFSAKTNGLGSDIDLDNNNHPHFAWRQKTPDIPNPFEEDSTMYRYYNGVAWSEPELVTEDPFSQKIQLFNNKAYIIDAEKNSKDAGNIVLYQKDDAGNWIGELVINIVGSIQRLLKCGNTLNLIYTAKPDDDNLNIYYMNKTVDTTTSIEENKFTLNSLEIYPNPFSEIANIEFNILKDSHVILRIHSFDGKVIKTIYYGNLPEGNFRKFWDGTNESGEKGNKGAYLIRLIADKNIIARSVIYLK